MKAESAFGLNYDIKKLNKQYQLKEGELISSSDELNDAGANITHDNTTGSSNPLKWRYQELIEDSKISIVKKPKLYDEYYKGRIKVPSISMLEKLISASYFLYLLIVIRQIVKLVHLIWNHRIIQV